MGGEALGEEEGPSLSRCRIATMGVMAPIKPRRVAAGGRIAPLFMPREVRWVGGELRRGSAWWRRRWWWRGAVAIVAIVIATILARFSPLRNRGKAVVRRFWNRGKAVARRFRKKGTLTCREEEHMPIMMPMTSSALLGFAGRRSFVRKKNKN